MSKALELLKKYGHHFNYHTANITMQDINEAIAELETQEFNSCEGCKYENKSDDNECFYCSRDCNYSDNYAPKATK